MSVGKSLKVPHLGNSNRRDSSLNKRSFTQPSTSTSLSCHSCRKIGYVCILGKIKESIANRVYRWVPKEKRNDSELEVNSSKY